MMQPQANEIYYKENKAYSTFLEDQGPNHFEKYAETLVKYSQPGDAILDMGCGTGTAIAMVKEKNRPNIKGIEISRVSIDMAKEKGLDCKLYDGKEIPYKAGSFRVIGSFNVIEHTDDPLNFLNEQARVLEKNGYLVLSCPNFLSVTNSYHWHTRGLKQKLTNLSSLIKILLTKKPVFEKVEPIVRPDFQPDDDAVNVTNPLSLIYWAKQEGFTLVEWSSQPFAHSTAIARLLDFGPLRLLLGSCFMIFKKNRPLPR